MADYLTTDTELTSIANAIRTKGGTSAALTYPAGFVTAIGNIQTGGNDFIVTLTKNSGTGYWEPDKTVAEVYAAYQAGKNIDIKADGGTNTLPAHISSISSSGFLYTVFEGTSGPGSSFYYVEKAFGVNSSGTVELSGTYYDYDTSDGTAVASHVPSGEIFYTSTGRETGSATSRTSSDLAASGATVTAPAGFYASAASKSVASGTAGTPTATKGTVSNHSVSVTPSVTNTTGYITGSTKTGTAVTVTASELVYIFVKTSFCIAFAVLLSGAVFTLAAPCALPEILA